MDFKGFMKLRLQASTDFVEGKFASLKDLSVSNAPATIFPPSGTIIQGASVVNEFNEKSAELFKPGAENSFEILHQYADEHVAYWAGVQRSKVQMAGHVEKVDFNLRVTEIFRKENGEWKLMHRHADNLKS